MTREELESLADKIYAKVPLWSPRIYFRPNGPGDLRPEGWIDNPAARPNLNLCYAMGLMRKTELTHGGYYLGACRNASVARWDNTRQLFRHVRHKFGNAFEEDIPHPEDQDGHDIFTPVVEIDANEDEHVRGGFEDPL